MTKPICTYLAYSAGVQSHLILEMVLRGELPRPEGFCVLHADPGMEDSRSKEFVARSEARCQAAGIQFIRAQGQNLLHDLLTFKERGLTRIDNPPYWTKERKTGKVGRLSQGCTQKYKIQPMRRALRRRLFEAYKVSLVTKRLPPVECWIGFSADEAHRRSESDVKFTRFRYPLIDLGFDRTKCEGYYLKHGIVKPPRSVCNACFSNGLAYYEDMYLNRPEDWDNAVAVDESVRDMTQVGIRDQVFVSPTCIPLKELPALDFKAGKDGKEHRCNSGVCFL